MAFALSANAQTSQPPKGKGLLFQISESTGRLLVNGDPFRESSTTFWKMWPGTCSFHCSNEKVIVLNFIRSPKKGAEYGVAVFVRAEDLYWYQSVFVPRKEVDSLGGIVKITGSPKKINFTFKEGGREYDRLDK